LSILCSSGAFISGKPDEDSILEVGPQLPIDGIEILVTRRMVGRLDEIGQTLRGCGLAFPVVHSPKSVGSRLPDDGACDELAETMRFARDVGASVVVLHLWDLPESDHDLDGRLMAAVIAAELAADNGVELALETIPCSRATPLTNLERVVCHEPRVGIALDTEFLAHHEEVEAARSADWLWEDGRVRHVHLKDFDSGLLDEKGHRRYLLPGDGGIDFPGFFATLADRNYTGTVSLEAPARTADGVPDVERLSRVLSRINADPWSFS
jgi:sugar phosphate isomerase/epimerase